MIEYTRDKVIGVLGAHADGARTTGPLTIDEISREALLSRSSVSRALDVMAAAGLVERVRRVRPGGTSYRLVTQ